MLQSLLASKFRKSLFTSEAMLHNFEYVIENVHMKVFLLFPFLLH
jgi:hypothetical protein